MWDLVFIISLLFLFYCLSDNGAVKTRFALLLSRISHSPKILSHDGRIAISCACYCWLLLGKKRERDVLVLFSCIDFPAKTTTSPRPSFPIWWLYRSPQLQQRTFKCLVLKWLSYSRKWIHSCHWMCDPFRITIFTLGCDRLRSLGSVTNDMAFNKFPSTSVFHRTAAINNRLRPVSWCKLPRQTLIQDHPFTSVCECQTCSSIIFLVLNDKEFQKYNKAVLRIRWMYYLRIRIWRVEYIRDTQTLKSVYTLHIYSTYRVKIFSIVQFDCHGN